MSRPLLFPIFVGSLLMMMAEDGVTAEADLAFHNNIGLFFGGSTVFSDERETSSLLGIEYERRFTPKWGLAGVAEKSVGDFERSHLLGVGATLRPLAGSFRLAFLLCAEYIDSSEVEDSAESVDGPKPIFRSGASYEFEIGRFTIEPALAVDLGGETDAILNYGVMFGLNF